MKAFTVIISACMMVFVSIIALPAPAYAEPLLGVKKGDWVEYDIHMTGPPLDPVRNLTWYKVEVLEVDGGWFEVNKTALTVNGIFSSSIWKFNLTDGQVQGWVIIPASLGVGDSFFDATISANIAIEGEEQKNLLGANRCITHASNRGMVYKEWDKISGFYVHTVSHTANYTFTADAIATNMWSVESSDENQTVTYITEQESIIGAAIEVATITAVVGLQVYFKKRRH